MVRFVLEKPRLTHAALTIVAVLTVCAAFGVLTPLTAFAADHGKPIPEYTWYGNSKSLRDGAGPTDNGVTASAIIYEDGCLVFETANGAKTTSLPGADPDFSSRTYNQYLPWMGKPITEVTEAMGAIKSVEFGIGVRPSVLSFYFKNCPKLQYVVDLPDSVNTLEQTFMGCTSLQEPPIIPEGVTASNMSGAFSGCSSMAVLPKGFRLPKGIDSSVLEAGEDYSALNPLITFCSRSDYDALKDLPWADYCRKLEAVGSVTIVLGAHIETTGGRLSQVCPTSMKEINVAPESGLVLAAPKVEGKGVTVIPMRNGSYNVEGKPLNDVVITFDDAKARIPFAEQELVYTGSELVGVAAGAGYEVVDGTATDAGSYTAVATALQGYAFTNDETSIDVPWSITPAEIAAPKAASGLFYTGSELVGVAPGEGYTVEGGTAVDAGDYTAKVTADGNHVFAGGATSVEVPWSIAKAPSAIALADQELDYTGSPLAYCGTVAKVGSTGEVTFAYYSDSGCASSLDASQVVEAGTYYVKATLAGDANHWGAESNVAALHILAPIDDDATPGASGSANGENVSATVKFSNKLTAKAKTIKVKASKLKKKTVKIKAKKAFKVTATAGKVSFKRGSISCKKKLAKQAKKKIKVSKTGKVTLKKGLKKGTYKVKVKVSAAGDKTHRSAAKTVKLKVIVK